jgi:histidine ammonia-lyase
MVNRRVHPVVPRFGSIGVADLPQLSHLALPLIGEGRAEVDGTTLPGGDALRRVGLAPVTLGPKDGLALISANAATITCGAGDRRRTATRRRVAHRDAVSLEGPANLSPPDARAARAGQVEVGPVARCSTAALPAPHAARRVQDPLSFRVVAQVQGSLQAALAGVRDLVEMELGSAAESPLVIAADGVMLSNGNFHLPALALALDAAAIALAQSTSLGAERVIRFMSPAFTDLPLQLTRHGPAHSGFATLQKTVTALWSEIRVRANPASLDFLPVSEGAEDHATMALGAVERLADMLERIGT